MYRLGSVVPIGVTCGRGVINDQLSEPRSLTNYDLFVKVGK